MELPLNTLASILHSSISGVDSLVGLELRNWLPKESGVELAMFEILGDVTLRGIGKLVAQKTYLRPETWGVM